MAKNMPTIKTLGQVLKKRCALIEEVRREVAVANTQLEEKTVERLKARFYELLDHRIQNKVFSHSLGTFISLNYQHAMFLDTEKF